MTGLKNDSDWMSPRNRAVLRSEVEVYVQDRRDTFFINPRLLLALLDRADEADRLAALVPKETTE